MVQGCPEVTFEYLFPQLNMSDPQWAFLAEKVTEFAKSQSDGARVVDIGAGDSKYGKLLPTSQYIATDLVSSSDRHDFSKINVICDASYLPFADEAFDVALSMAVLEHVPNPYETVQEMSRVLRTGGTAVVILPLVRPEHMQPFDYHRFTRYAVAQMFERASLDVVELAGSNGALWSAFYYLRQLLLDHPIRRYGRYSLRGRILNRFWYFALAPLGAYARNNHLRYGSEFPIYYWVVGRKRAAM